MPEQEQRKPTAIRLSNKEIETLKEAAETMNMGWTSFMRSVAIVAAERIISMRSQVP